MGFMVHFLLGLVLFSSTCWLLEGVESQQVQQNDDKLVSQQNTHINENEKKTENEGKFLRNVNSVKNEGRIETNKKTGVSTEKNNDVNKQSNSSSINSSIIKLQQAAPYSKDDSREDVGRSIDIDKYVSEDFHNKNNVYTVPVSPDTEKFINPDYDYISSSSHHYHNQATSFSFSSELTTPISSIFDNRYKETVKNVDQTLEHIPDLLDDSTDALDQSKEIDLDKLYEATQNGTQTNLDYNNFKNIIKNDTDRKNAIHKDLTVESGSNLNFVSSYNKTDVVDESSNYTFPRTSTEKPEMKTQKPLVLTTKKNTVLTKPPSNINVSHILSNKIETELVKSPTTATPSPRLYTRTTQLDKRGSVKFADYVKSSTSPPKKSNKSEQLVQENQIIPIHVEAPLPETTTIAATATTEATTATTEANTATTEATTATIEATTIALTAVEDTTIDVTTTSPTSTVATSTDTTTSSCTTTDAVITSTTTDSATTEVTTVAEEQTTESQLQTTSERSATTEATTIAATEQTTITEPANVVVETTTLSSTTTESMTTTENTATQATSTFEPTTALPDITTDSIRTSKGVDFDKTTTEAMEVTTEISKETTTTAAVTASVSFTPKFPVNVTAEIKRGPDVSTTTTTEIVFVHIENNQTTLLPETLNPEYNYPAPDRNDMTGNSTPTSSGNGGLKDSDGSEDNSGTIAAIAISSVGAVCLILLAGLLFIMKKRQKRFSYGQRCTPVSLDDYSMDNVSVYNSVRRKAALRSSKRSYGNPAFDDPVCVSHPLNFPALGKFANNTEELKAEFEEIPQIHARTNELPEGCDSKNRYANVIPLPETRVFLTPIDGYPNSDYINANYVTGPKNTKGYYIAAQAPLQNTVDDFWRMIWEQNSKVILMLTHLFENGVEKCVDYLPPSEVLDCHRLFGDFQITLKKREVKDKYIISTVQLKNMVSNSWREVTHFWYLGWPEKGVPSEANSLIAFLIEARSYMKSSADKNKEQNGSLSNGKAKNELNPVIVHCSPGTGRAGVVIACDICIREFEQDRIIDIPRIVYRIRRDRASAVQTKEQYAFIYKVVNLYATKLAGGALDSI